MKLFTVSFFENDGDGSVESHLYGIFESYELAYAALEEVIAKDGHDMKKMYVCPPEYLYGALFKIKPRYGEYEIRPYELNKIEQEA